ncbi:MAG: methyltransferase domain-containing protein [Burkholderiales bacterium]|nr:methyltransferase domain-containing protein [Burkholderiales bacterium]
MSDKSMNWAQAVEWLRQQPGQEELVRACFYDDPLIDAARRFHASGEWQAVRAFLPQQPGRALDVGAGRGIASYALVRDGWQVTALEPDPSDIVGAEAIRALAREASLKIDVVSETGEKLPFADNSFDLVYCRQALHHARNLRQFCKEIARVLRTGGTFIATREHVISSKKDLTVFLNNHPLHHLYGGEHAYLMDEYLSAIRDAGIHISQTLNPLASEINLYPETFAGVKQRVARLVFFPFPSMIPKLALRLLGRFVNEPGRLYSFVGMKVVR